MGLPESVYSERKGCLRARTDYQINLNENYKPVDLGFNEVVKGRETGVLATNLTLSVVTCALISYFIVQFLRHRRSFGNSVILVECNEKLESLLWILTVHLYPENEAEKKQQAEQADTAERRKNLFDLELGRLSAVSKELIFNQSQLKRRY
jgi:hypothetical protein